MKSTNFCEAIPGVRARASLVCLGSFLTVAGILAGGSCTPSFNPPVSELQAPSSLTATAVSESEIVLEWEDTNDTEEGYLVERSLSADFGVALSSRTTENATGLQDSDRDPGTTYYYRVWAFVGNKHGPSSEVVSVTTPGDDATPPTASITAPADGSSYTTAQTVTLTVGASDNVGVTEVGFYAGTTLKGTDTSEPYTFDWVIGATDNGTHSFTARAHDAAGNSADSDAITLTVDIPTASCPAAPTTPPATTTTLTDLVLSSGESDLVYDGVHFLSSGSFQQATVTLTDCHDITFRNCVFDGSAWNNISINDTAHSVYNITFENCYVKGSDRMGFECTSRGSGSAVYTNVQLRGVTFEPQGSEAVSFDGPAVPTNSGVCNVVILGSGNRPDLHPWGQGFELNGPHNFAIDGLTIYRTGGSNFNLSGTGNVNWTFNNVTVDNTVDNLAVARSSDANVVYANNMDNTLWTNSTITNDPPGGAMFYLSNCHGNDFQGVDLYGSPSHTSEVNGSSGNLF